MPEPLLLNPSQLDDPALGMISEVEFTGLVGVSDRSTQVEIH